MELRFCSNNLSEDDVKQLVLDAEKKLIEYSKYEDIIGDQIFKLLELNSRVLYYPLDDEDIWGFMERIQNKIFVCINTSIPYDKQVFAAAHELYHIWFNNINGQELILSSNLEDQNNNEVEVNELKANRFAAEFLARKDLLIQEMIRYNISRQKVTIKEVLHLGDIFTLPYKTMVRRLNEIGVIKESEFNTLMSVSLDEIVKVRTILGISLPIKENHIALDNLVEKAVELYEHQLISYEKFEHLLNFANLVPEDVGISYIY